VSYRKMHFLSSLAIVFLLLAVHQSTAQLRTKAEREECMAHLMGVQKTETDKELEDKSMKAQLQIKGTVDMVSALNSDQKAKLVNTYFIGVKVI
ncbi:hypothetical protein PMAYCL1PPCAC_13042, partial [Pristionchus mayeri]